MPACLPATSHGSPGLPWLTLGLAGACLDLHALLGPAASGLILDRAAVAAGEAWRLLTGHLVHADAGHLAWNLGAFLLLGGLLERQPGGRRLLAAALVAGAAVVSLGVWLARPDLARYCGLSGVLNTVFAVLLAALWRRTRSPLWPALGVLDLHKTAVESALGAALFTDTAWPAVPEAHFAGLLAALPIVAAVLRPESLAPARTIAGRAPAEAARR